MITSASDTGDLYWSFTPRDVSDASNEAGLTIDRHHFTLKSPIKELGLHEIEIKSHPEVSASVIVNFARSLEEAKLQASGKSIQGLAAKKEQEAEFEIDELFDDSGSAALDDEDLRTDEKPAVVEDIETETSPDIKTE